MANDKIVIHGARAHNLKNIDVTIPRNKLVVMTGLLVPVSRVWRLIRYMQKASAAMSKAYLLMHASFLVKWRNRMLIRLMVSVRQFRLIKRRLPRIRARQLERSLKLMITCDCCGRGSGIRFVLTMGRRLPVKVLNKWWTASWLCRKRAAFRFCHRLCGGKRQP